MNKLIILAAFLCLSLSGSAQQTIVEGVLKDSVGSPLEFATVMAFNKSDESTESYALTNSDGYFKLKLVEGKPYIIRYRYLGYETAEEEIVAKGSVMKLMPVLTEEAVMLDGVEVVYEFPITMNGDTISYKAEAFSNGKERKLGNLLEKLPGFEVSPEGEIKVQGKMVDKVLIEGKEFFSGDSKMATKNIPADVVDRLDLIRDYNNVGPMQGLGTDESLALNIRLKDGNKSMWFGDIEAGAGPDNRYLAHPNLFYYSPKTSINFIGDLNNIGEQAFTMQDYFRFNGGFRSIGSNGGSTFNLSSDELGLALMENNRAFNINSSLAAMNITHNPNKKWSISGYGIASGIDARLKSSSFRNYIRAQSQTNELTESELDQNLFSGLAKIDVTYKPSRKLFLGYQSFLKKSSIEDFDNRISTFGSTINPLRERNTRAPFSFDQKLEFYNTLNQKNILSVEASWEHKKQTSGYFLNTENKPFSTVLPLDTTSQYLLDQDVRINTDKIESAINYYYLLNQRNHLNVTAGVTSSIQDYQSSIRQTLDDGSVKNLSDNAFVNDSKFNFIDTYLSLHYKAKIGKLTLSPGINLHNYNTNDTQSGVSRQSSKTLWLPDLFAKYDFGSSENLTFNYGLKAEFTDIKKLGRAITIRNYTSLFSGNRQLQNIVFHQLNLSYMNFDMFNFTNFYLMVNYQKRQDDITESVSYQGTDRLSFPTNTIEANDMLFINGSFEKKFTFMKAKLEAGINYTSMQNLVELESNRNFSFKQNYKLSFESNFVNIPNIEIGLENSWSDYTSANVAQKYTNTSPFANIEAIVGDFVLVADYTYNNYQADNSQISSEYDFLNTSVYYRKSGSPWEFKVAGNNLLNTEYIRRDSFDDNVISTYQYFVQPRYFMFTVMYDL
jgi:hypothetical protein